MTTVQLANVDAKLAYLAVQYHLARPGSEMDAETRRPAEHGLAEVARTLEPQLQQAVATIELDGFQQRRLISAVAGAVNELKSYPLLGGGARSTVPAFGAALRRLFPEVEEEPEAAVQLAGHLVALRRRLESVAPGAEPESRRRPWWRFWQRDGGENDA